MSKEYLTEAEIEWEIEELKNDPYVKLAKKAERIKHRRLNQLRHYRSVYKRGVKLAEQGITFDNIEEKLR